MRLIRLIVAALIVSVPGPAFAQPPSPAVGSQSDPTSQRWLGGPQGTAPASLAVAERGGGEWIEFASRDDRFTCNFPGQPKVTAATWTSEYGAALRARVYSAELGPSRYSMMVVDYNPIERILTEKAKACPPGAETCSGISDTGVGYWKNDVRGAVVYATWKLMQQDVKVTYLVWNFMDMVAGQLLQLTNNADKSRTFASIYMHENKLYVMEGTVPAGYPEPGLFQQSLGWLDEQGNGIRYSFVYYNDPDLKKPEIRRRTPQQRDDGRIDAPGAPGGQAR